MTEDLAQDRYVAALDRGLSETKAREEGWPREPGYLFRQLRESSIREVSS